MVKIIEPKTSYAVDEPTNQDYLFQHLEDIKHEDPEYAEWGGKQRPREKVTVQNQFWTPACTAFSQGHIANALNLIEDTEIWEVRPQISNAIWWDEFCKLRNKYNVGASIQAMAQFFKNKGIIEWYVTIPSTAENLVAKMKKAIDNGNFMCSWSSNGDRTQTSKTWNYTLRTDWKFVWHAWAYVDYGDGYFWAINSFWPNRGIYKWYFKVPFEMVAGTYSKLCIIDKNDMPYFQKLKDRIKVEKLKELSKELYMTGNTAMKAYFEEIQLSKNLDKLYY